MDQMLMILIILLLVLIILLIMGLSIVLFLLYKRGMKKDSKTIPTIKTLNCSNHPQLPSEGLCAICGEAFCDSCLKQHDKLLFCPEHYKLFLSHQWEEVETVVTTPDKPELAYHLYSFKDEKWLGKRIPTYIITHYKIDVESDHIESHIKLYVRAEELKTLKEELKKPHQ